MHKRPLAVIAAFFILGIVLARFLPDTVTLFHVFVVTLIFILLCLLLALISCRAGLNLPYSENGGRSRSPGLNLGYGGNGGNMSGGKGKAAHIFLFLSIISVGALLYLNSNIFPPEHISHFLGKDKLKAEITGVIKSPAEARGIYYGKVSSRYVFELEEVHSPLSMVHGDEWIKVNGLALIKIQTEKDYQYGDRLRVKGTIKRPGLPNDTSWRSLSRAKLKDSKNIARSSLKLAPLLQNSLNGPKTNFNYKQYLENQNIFAIISTSDKHITLLVHNYKINPILRYAYFIREKLRDKFIEKMPLESGAFLRAILLGDRSELPKRLNESFRNSGTMHILAISGLNVSLIAVALIYFFKLLRIKREIYYVVTILFLIFLAILTGGSPSVVRATVMSVVFLIGMLLGRGVDAYNSLSVAALFILVKNPKDLFDVGFQLSFVAVLSMIYITPKLMKFIKSDVYIYLRRYIYVPLAVSISASLGTFPLILYYFRMVTPIAIIANMFIVPLMFIVLIGAMCFAALCWVPFVSGILAYINNILAQLLFLLADFFSRITFGHFYI